MIKYIYIVIVLSVVNLNCFAQMNKATIQVFDENTNVMSDVSVRLSFVKLEGVSNRFKDTTDKNGKCTITGYGDGGGIFVYAKKDGYYHSSTELYFVGRTGIRNFGFWQPWNPKFKLYLTKIDNLIPMYTKRCSREKLPVVEQKVGYDFRKGDWVYDGYTGENVDIYFHYEDLPLKEIIANGRKMMATYNRKMTISFPNEKDGIISVDVPDFRSKGLILPKIAPEKGYQTNLIKTAKSGQLSTYKISENYFIRVNTETDKQGNIIKANYGKIYSGLDADPMQSITYYLNPAPNNRNVECDISTNLIVNISEDERPWKP
jgi:hypothetical protein